MAPISFEATTSSRGSVWNRIEMDDYHLVNRRDIHNGNANKNMRLLEFHLRVKKQIKNIGVVTIIDIKRG